MTISDESNRLNTLIGLLGAGAANVLKISIDAVTTALGAAGALATRLDTLNTRTGGWSDRHYFVNPATIGGTGVLTALPSSCGTIWGATFTTVEGVCVNVEGAQIAGIMSGEVSVNVDSGFDAVAENYDLGVGWDPNTAGKVSATAANATLVQAKVARLVVGAQYFCIINITDYTSGTIAVACGSTGAGAARSAANPYGEIVTCAGDGKLGVKAGAGASAFTGKVGDLLAYRLGGWMAANDIREVRYTTIAAVVVGTSSASVSAEVYIH